jgi:hypothetical protein
MALDPISAVSSLADDIISRIWPDPADQAKADVVEAKAKIYAYVKTEVEPALAQLEVNKTEAASASIFVAGWRPFVGWVCGVALAYQYIAQPLLAFILSASGIHFTVPVFDFSQLVVVLMGMLGLGAMRTAEKMSAGVDANTPDVAPQSARKFPWQK